MAAPDFAPATDAVAHLIATLPDEALGAPTPCPDYRVGDLVEHVGGLAAAFTSAARKDGDPAGGPPPEGDAARLPADWRTAIPRDLSTMAAAWRDPDAWSGMTRAGGLDLPGEVAGLVALDEVVIHGWDLARAIGVPYAVDPDALDAVHGFVAQFSGPGNEDQREGLFGPEVPVDDAAPLLDRVVGMTGRDPSWSPA